MHASFKTKQACRGVWTACVAGALTAIGGCSSQPLDLPAEPRASGGAAAGGNAQGGSASRGGSGSAGKAADGLDYQNRDYPPGPYGTGIGAKVENFGFLGWRDPVASNYDVERLEPLHLSDFYNPDGRRDVKVIWINASAVWCSVCKAEMAAIKDNNVHAEFGAKGVQMLATLFEDKSSQPAKPSDLRNWGMLPAHSIDYPLVLDPGFKLGAFFSSDATPLNMLIDARTMRVLDATMGYSQDYWQRVDELLDKLP